MSRIVSVGRRIVDCLFGNADLGGFDDFGDFDDFGEFVDSNLN